MRQPRVEGCSPVRTPSQRRFQSQSRPPAPCPSSVNHGRRSARSAAAESATVSASQSRSGKRSSTIRMSRRQRRRRRAQAEPPDWDPAPTRAGRPRPATMRRPRASNALTAPAKSSSAAATASAASAPATSAVMRSRAAQLPMICHCEERHQRDDAISMAESSRHEMASPRDKPAGRNDARFSGRTSNRSPGESPDHLSASRLWVGGSRLSPGMRCFCHARSTKASMTFLSPACSKSIASLLSSTARTVP